MTPAALSQVNDMCINAKKQLLDRLDDLEAGASESDRFNIAQQRAEITAELHRAQIIQIRLAAANVVVAPFDPVELQQLNVRANLLDNAIISNTILTADLTLVTQLAASAKGIGDIVNRHTSSA